jgi:hypothetical protein
MAPLLPVAALLELATTVAWATYCLADRARDNFNEWWRVLDARLPSSWYRE